MAGSSMLVGLYQTPAIYVNVKGVMTNTVPTDAYRGAGRPEAAYLLERFVDHIARETGLAPDEIRARNFIKPSQIPWKTALGDTYDSGDFETVMRKGMEKADWKGFAARRAASDAKGKWRGIGMATYVEKCGGGGAPETAIAKFNDDDTVTLYLGNQTNGQGHETAIRQIASARLGIDAERIHIVQGDSDVTPEGMTGGSRMVSVAGVATLGVADKIIAKGKLVAASALEASAADIDYADGAFKIVGTDRTMSLFDVAKAAKDPKHVPTGEKPGLDDEFTRTPDADTFPNGCHICELEIDPDTGTLEILNYSVMDDFGSGAQSAAAAGPGPWRRRPGRRPGADREDGLRQGLGPALSGSLHGLCPAARRHRAARALRHAQQPVHDQSAGREGRGRGRRHRRAAGGDQRHRRRDPSPYRAEACRHAGDGSEPVGGDRRPSAEEERHGTDEGPKTSRPPSPSR